MGSLICPLSRKVSILNTYIQASVHTKQTLNMRFYIIGSRNPKPLRLERAGFPNKALFTSQERWAWALRWSRQIQPFAALFVWIISRAPISTYLVTGVCCEHLSTSIWPGPKSISQETKSCQMVLLWGEYHTRSPLCHRGGANTSISVSGST